MIPIAPYLPTTDPACFESTPLARAGWSEHGQHGGVIGALLGRAIESVPALTHMEIARITIELFRMVPIVPIRLSTRIVKEGKKIQVVEASAHGPDGTELAKATGVRIRVAQLSLPKQAAMSPSLSPPPDELPSQDMASWGIGGDRHIIIYHRHAIEVREIAGGFSTPGPGSLWMRVHTPLVAGEPISPLTRAIVTGDFINGLSRLVETDDFYFMNTDLTLNFARMPRGEWIGLSAVSQYDHLGRGIASGELFDTVSRFGRSTQTLFLEPT